MAGGWSALVSQIWSAHGRHVVGHHEIFWTNVRQCVFMRMMNGREIIAKLTGDGWFKIAQKGDHVQFKHPTRPGRVTVPHPARDIPIGTLKSIEKQSGLKMR